MQTMHLIFCESWRTGNLQFESLLGAGRWATIELIPWCPDLFAAAHLRGESLCSFIENQMRLKSHAVSALTVKKMAQHYDVKLYYKPGTLPPYEGGPNKSDKP